MKSILYLICIALLATFISCSDKVEDSFKEIETNLNIDIPINPLVKSHDKTSVDNHKFLGLKEDYISQIVNQKENVANISELRSRNGSILMLSGIMEDYELSSLSLIWNYKSSVNPKNIVEESIDLLALDYTINNSVFEVNIDNELNNLINKIDDPNGSIKVEISGICNYNLSTTANLSIPIVVKSKINIPRFELY